MSDEPHTILPLVTVVLRMSVVPPTAFLNLSNVSLKHDKTL